MRARINLRVEIIKECIEFQAFPSPGRGTSRAQQLALRRALADEHEVLSCLRYCLRSSDAAVRVARYPPGLYTLAVATLSNLPRSRTLALEVGMGRKGLSMGVGSRECMESGGLKEEEN